MDTGDTETDRPGREVSKDYRRVIDYLIDSQGWRYELPSGGGVPTDGDDAERGAEKAQGKPAEE